MKRDQSGELQQPRHNALLALLASMKRTPTRRLHPIFRLAEVVVRIGLH